MFLNSICVSIFIVLISFYLSELATSCVSAVFNLACLLDLNLGSCVSAIEAVNQMKAVNQLMASCVAQRIASCEAQLLMLLFIQLNFMLKSC